MFTKVRSLMSRFHRDEEGVTLVEYGIALVLAITLGTGALIALSDSVGGIMGTASGQMDTAVTTAAGG